MIVENEKFLAIKRSESVRAPGKICFPGGSVELGESEEDAICRELDEELGVQIRLRKKIFSNRSPWGVQLNWWTADLPKDHDLKANPDEVAEIRWMSLSELRDDRDLLSSNIVFLEAIRQGEITIEGLTTVS